MSGIHQKFESENDRNNERMIAAILESEWDVRFRKLPVHLRVDYAVLHKYTEDVTGFAEFKRRTYVKFGDFANMRISLSKLQAAKLVMETTGKPFMLVIQFTDSIRYAIFRRASDMPFLSNVVWGGRNAMRVPDDEEVMVEIPISIFKEVTGGNKDLQDWCPTR